MTHRKNESIIEISEEFHVPGTNMVLEPGDKIKVLQEMSMFTPIVNELRKYVQDMKKTGYTDEQIGQLLGKFLLRESGISMLVNPSDFIQGLIQSVR